MAVGFDGEYWKVLWALLPRLPCLQVTFGWEGSPLLPASGGGKTSVLFPLLCTHTSPYPRTPGAVVLGLWAGYVSGKEKAPGDS